MGEFSNRQRLILGSVILGLFMIYWGFSGTPQEVSNQPSPISEKIDYFGEQISTREWNEAGELKREMHSSLLEHNPGTHLNHLEAPESINYRSDNSFIKITAEHGSVLDDNSMTELAGNVIVLDNPSSDSVTTLKTETLSIYPDRNLAETDKKVTITSPRGKTTGTGMEIYFEDRVLNLHSDVQGIYNNAE